MDSTTFKIIAWNIHGGAGAQCKRRVRELVRTYKPSIFSVVETHCHFDRVSSFWHSLGYELIRESSAIGHYGGIWVLIPHVRDFEVHVVELYDQAVSVAIRHKGRSWVCSLIYTSPNLSKRLDLWAYLSRFRLRHSDPWLVLGDFNEIYTPLEVRTSLGKGWKMGIGLLPREAYVEVLARVYSDHTPIIVRCTVDSGDRATQPFRFQAAWATHPSFTQLVRDTWSKPPPSLTGKLKNIHDAATVFNKNVFGCINRWKKRVEHRLQGVQKELDYSSSESLCRFERALRKEYDDILFQEELLWYQKSRENWVQFGDRNTKFFHMQTIVRRKRNKIHGLL
ncbi:PREDICTED: uncharacterized protein LOC109340077 [Lupinus angustifolius]|uniref:uncharacterized protein LOC109340077 n=1 Tax=Lupinus angustifolius TaxID=3871 RepID=UPI00092F4609|nr:PREDICTED: uncharacterized protein LOC109340077 [Lupinus angustifolius]